MYLEKLERVQKQTEAKGAFTLEKQQLEIVRIVTLQLFKIFAWRHSPTPTAEESGSGKTSGLLSYSGKNRVKIEKLPGHLRGGALESKKTIEEG